MLGDPADDGDAAGADGAAPRGPARALELAPLDPLLAIRRKRARAVGVCLPLGDDADGDDEAEPPGEQAAAAAGGASGFRWCALERKWVAT